MEDGLNLHGINPEEVSKLQTLFKLLDEEEKGGVNLQEMSDLMSRMGVMLSTDEMSAYFASVDTDNSGLIDFSEFLQLMAWHKEATQLALLEGGCECFRHLKAASSLKYVLRSDHPFNWVFDVVTMVMILFWVGVATYEDVDGTEILYGLPTKAACSVLLALDVPRGLMTSTTQTDEDTLPVDSKEHARKQYLHSRRFIIDVVAAIPLDIMCRTAGSKLLMRVFQNIRIVKVFAWPMLFRLSPCGTMSPLYARFYFLMVPILSMVFWACLVVHALGVTWLLISRGTIVPAATYTDAIYFVMFTLTTTGNGDIKVITDGQKVYCIFLFCCASVVTGLVVGKLVKFSQQADLTTDAHRRMLETLAALNHLTIPNDFKEEVLAFQLHRLKHSNSLFNESLSGLPAVMQDRMALYARMKIVRQVPIFADAPEICVAKLAQSLVNVFVPPEEYIVIAGEEGEEMFFLFHGMCGVMLPNGKWLATIARGGVFGEVALLQETRRSASVRSLTYCQLFRLDKIAFETISSQFPKLQGTIEANSQSLKLRVQERKEEVEMERLMEEAAATHNAGDAPRTSRISIESNLVRRLSQAYSSTQITDMAQVAASERAARSSASSRSSSVPSLGAPTRRTSGHRRATICLSNDDVNSPFPMSPARRRSTLDAGWRTMGLSADDTGSFSQCEQLTSPREGLALSSVELSTHMCSTLSPRENLSRRDLRRRSSAVPTRKKDRRERQALDAHLPVAYSKLAGLEDLADRVLGALQLALLEFAEDRLC